MVYAGSSSPPEACEPRHKLAGGSDVSVVRRGSLGGNQADLPGSYVRRHAATTIVCFIVDALSRRIVGWRVAGAGAPTSASTGSRRPGCLVAPDGLSDWSSTPMPGRSPPAATAATRSSSPPSPGCTGQPRPAPQPLRRRAPSRGRVSLGNVVGRANVDELVFEYLAHLADAATEADGVDAREVLDEDRDEDVGIESRNESRHQS